MDSLRRTTIASALAVTGLLATGLAVVASVAVVVRRKWTVVRVSGTSMEPALRDGDRLLARRVRAGHPLNRGDLVVLRPPAAPSPCRRAPTRSAEPRPAPGPC